MKTINDLTETKFRTVYFKDALGNKIKDKEVYIAKRPVRVVSGGQRFGNSFIDFWCFLGIYKVFEYLYSLISVFVESYVTLELTVAFVLFFISFLSLSLFYFVFEYYFQKTPAKMLLRTVVIDKYANKPDIKSLVVRSIVRLIPLDPLSFLFSSRGWHNSWSGTYVVSNEEEIELKRLIADQGNSHN